MSLACPGPLAQSSNTRLRPPWGSETPILGNEACGCHPCCLAVSSGSGVGWGHREETHAQVPGVATMSVATCQATRKATACQTEHSCYSVNRLAPASCEDTD